MSLRATLSDTLSFGPSNALAAAGTTAGEKVLASFEVWFDAATGAGTHRGTISGVTATLPTGVTDEGDYWDCSGGAAEGIEVDNYTGEKTIDGTADVGDAGNEALRGFMVCDMGAITPGSTNRQIFSNKVSLSAAGFPGLYIRHTANDAANLQTVLANASASSVSGAHATNIESAGRVMIFWWTHEVTTTSTLSLNIITSGGLQTPVTDDFDGFATLEIPTEGIVFGAGSDADPPNAAGGPDGAATWHIYAVGFDRSQNKAWADADAEAVAAHYGVT